MSFFVQFHFRDSGLGWEEHTRCFIEVFERILNKIAQCKVALDGLR